MEHHPTAMRKEPAKNQHWADSSPELERLAAAVQARLGGQVRNLRLLLRDNGLVLQGRARTYYAMQLAQHAAMKATEYRIQANKIKVD